MNDMRKGVMMMNKIEKKQNKKSPRRRSGFSLLIVLITSMMALAMLGVLMQVSTSSAGMGRSASAKDVKYNFLQNGIEQGKAELRKIVMTSPEIPRYTYKFGGAEPSAIADMDDLLISSGDVITESWDRSRLGKLGIAGDTARFKVRIYDMQYNPTLVSGISDEERDLLPPSTILSAPGGITGKSPTPLDADDDGSLPGSMGAASNVGAYLVRASIEIDGKESILDTAIIQANMK
ncbi:MAG: hypothetical protein LBT23_01630 [Synergistaceae bacterium]|jgi:hypothetical protein|nr:hypothetical protein [Synergistaceae bacterium]